MIIENPEYQGKSLSFMYQALEKSKCGIANYNGMVTIMKIGQS